ncbi:hypothetical protein R1flu_025178 [Riccia fluitans]|uniref:C3H1-type domain-containing protein n=1 Tax=Riccia fluitans TaxID=41844 RepID=A0ABD1XZZ7_9MARC
MVQLGSQSGMGSSTAAQVFNSTQMQPPPQYQGHLGYPSQYQAAHSPTPTFNPLVPNYGQGAGSAQQQGPGRQLSPQQLQQSYAYDAPSNGLKRSSDEALQSVDLFSKRPRPDSSGTVAFYPQRPGERLCAFYMTTRTCSFGVSCRFDHPAWVPFGGIPNWKEVTTSGSAQATTDPANLPQRPGEPDCAFYMKRGECKYGQRCKFNHPKDRRAASSDSAGSSKEEGVQGVHDGSITTTTGAGVNGISAEHGTPVKSGATGTNISVTPTSGATGKVERGSVKPPPLNSKGLPMRPGENECTFYIKTGSCKYGAACRFNHPEIIKSDRRTVPQVSTQNHQSTNVIPQVSYTTGSFPSRMQPPNMGPQLTYATPGTGMLPIVPYPQRPGDPDCSYYLKTGECSFGGACKFHHPPGRIPSNLRFAPKLTLAGLPRRQGEPMCAYYLKTGACKYGSTCRFDHPPPGEAAAKLAAEPGEPAEPAEPAKLDKVDSLATETEMQEVQEEPNKQEEVKQEEPIDVTNGESQAAETLQGSKWMSQVFSEN